jgi:hypothetical protein
MKKPKGFFLKMRLEQRQQMRGANKVRIWGRNGPGGRNKKYKYPETCKVAFLRSVKKAIMAK